MMSQSRRFIIIGGMLGALVLIVVSFTLLSSRNSYESTCNKFIGYVVASDSRKTYAMFSTSARALGSQTEWDHIIKGWYNYFYKGKATLNNTLDLTPKATDSNKKPTPRQELVYTVNAPGSIIKASCYVIKTSDGFKVDSFNIGPNGTGNNNETQ